jgi:hypothetical protein
MVERAQYTTTGSPQVSAEENEAGFSGHSGFLSLTKYLTVCAEGRFCQTGGEVEMEVK